MLIKEAEWTADYLNGFAPEDLSPLLNIGSSTLEYRTQKAPHIDELIFAPLRAKGVEIVHFDLKEGNGIDITGDILNDDDFARVRDTVKPKMVICGNVLEHVLDPGVFARRCFGLVAPGGRLLLTVPRSYPHHRDPIDTMFRPEPEDVLALLNEPYECELATKIETGSYRDNLKERPWIITRQLRVLAPFLGIEKWKRSAAKFYWMFNPYLQTCVSVKRPAAE